jgi:hypothetical protein
MRRPFIQSAEARQRIVAMRTAPVRFRSRLALVTLLATVPVLSLAVAQTVGPYNEYNARRQVNVKDTNQTWALDFRFKSPRLLTVDVPGRGKKIVWYMWYQVINRTGESRTFVPDFELVTLDKHTVHHDQVLPKAEEAIRRIEDPTRYLDIKNSVTIQARPIPITKPDSAPRAITGVAIWDDVFAGQPDTTRFSVFVSGLSNGWSKDDQGTVRRKTLQLNFKRLSDRTHLDAEVKFLPPEEWIYRAMTPVKKAEEKEKK